MAQGSGADFLGPQRLLVGRLVVPDVLPVSSPEYPAIH